MIVIPVLVIFYTVNLNVKNYDKMMDNNSEQQQFAFSRINKTVFKLVKEIFPGGKILELGSGKGGLTYHLKQAGFDVTASDLDPDNFRVEGVECLKIDLEKKFDVPDNSFDGVISIETIEHLEDHFSFIRECNRILKPGGLLIVTTPNILNMASRIRFFLTGFFTYNTRPNSEFERLPIYQHINPINYYNLRYILHTNGFTIQSVPTDRYRSSALWLFFWFPILYPFTFWTMRGNTDLHMKQVNQDIARQILTKELLYGRTLITVSRKTISEEERQ